LVEILREVAAGDQQALGDLYDTTSNVVFGLLFRILSAREEAEEVLLDVYSQVWRQAARYSEARGTPMAWLTTIARSRAIDRLRSSQTERKRAEPLDVVIGHATSGRGVEEVAQASELGRVVRAALNQLTREQREVIELAYYEGMSHGEIAAHTGQPLGTVKTRTRLGMMRLRELLKSTYEAVK
jgi:RNA polymerase sigma-70 factor, ECF subfamily